jgi:hypothetical protein
MISLHTICYTLSYNGSLIMATKPKTKHRFHAAKLLFYSLQKQNYLNKRSIYISVYQLNTLN